MIHLEAGHKACKDNDLPPGVTIPEEFRVKDLGWQEYFWPTLVELVQKADEYGFKLTLAFNPQWGEYIAIDGTRLDLVRQWQTNGHEIGVHHHALAHPDWDGYSNGPDAVNEPLYRGTVNDGFSHVATLASPESIISSAIGSLPLDYPTLMNSPAVVLGAGNQYDSYLRFGPLRSLKPEVNHTVERDFVTLPMRAFSSVMEISLSEALPILEQQYKDTKDGEVFGIVWHEFDYRQAKDFYVQWFEFIKKNGNSIRTMKEIGGEYFE